MEKVANPMACGEQKMEKQNEVLEEEQKNSEEEIEEVEEELEEVDDDETEKDVADFDDNSVEEQKEETQKKTQSKEENHKYAELRRAKEQAEKEAYKKGLLDGVGGRNPYTGEEMVDDYDVEIYQQMKEIEKRGGDPIEDYAKFTKIFKQEARAKEDEVNKAEIERAKTIEKNKREFDEKYPDIDRNKLLEDEDFKDFALEPISNGETLVKVYERYLRFTAKYQKIAEDKANKKVAKSVSSVGSLGSSGEDVEPNFSRMTNEEFRKWDKKYGYGH